MKTGNNYAPVITLLLATLFVIVWGNVLFIKTAAEPAFYFLDVGQGDSELVIFPGGVKIMTDAGPDKKIIKSLESVLGNDSYIDIGIISHPQLDHFNGFNYLLEKYTFGAFIINGRNDSETVAEWPSLLKKIKEKNIPIITMNADDTISYKESSISLLSPDASYIESEELNDTGFVELIETGGKRALFVADIGANVEEYILKKFGIRADILKVAHHGSKYSSSKQFLASVNPKAVVIGVGRGNRYGHPAADTLDRLANITKNIFRTDQNGTVKIIAGKNTLSVFVERTVEE